MQSSAPLLTLTLAFGFLSSYGFEASVATSYDDIIHRAQSLLDSDPFHALQVPALCFGPGVTWHLFATFPSQGRSV